MFRISVVFNSNYHLNPLQKRVTVTVTVTVICHLQLQAYIYPVVSGKVVALLIISTHKVVECIHCFCLTTSTLSPFFLFLDKNPSFYMQFIALIFKLKLVYVIYLRIDIKIITISMAFKSIKALLIRVQCTRTY